MNNNLVKCPFCAEEIENDLEFCPICDTQLKTQCPFCKEEVKTNATKCRFCGETLHFMPKTKKEIIKEQEESERKRLRKLEEEAREEQLRKEKEEEAIRLREQRQRELEEARLAEEAKKRENKEQLKKHIKKYKFIYVISIFILAAAVASSFIFLGNPSRYEIYSLENECENQNGDSCMKLAYFYNKEHDIAAKPYADKAISLLKEKCKSDSKACYQLGLLYEHGDYQTSSFTLEKIKNVDYKEAYEYYKTSCKLDNAQACDKQKALEDDAKIACEIGISDGCIKLAKDYEQKNDLEHANEIYTKLCNNNDKEACKALASNLLKGNPSEKNIKVAYEIYKKVDASKANTVFNGEHGCLLNNSLACFGLGLEYYNKGDYKKANEYYEMGCNLGNGESCTNLGVNYQMGKGVSMDIDKAKEFYQKACDIKDGFACQNLAFIYYIVEEKIDSAAINFEKACNLGMAKSCGYASELFKDDANSFKDLKKAIEFAKKGCDLKDGKSCFILGAGYGEGDGIKKDLKEANKYYQKACDLNNDADGCASLGYNYKYGYGITKDLTLANEYNKKACDAGSGRGCNYLGVNYRDGAGFDKNMQKAYSYFKKSCYDYNYARGCTNLGEILCIYGNYTNAKQEAQDALNKAYYELGDKKALDILNKYFSY